MNSTPLAVCALVSILWTHSLSGAETGADADPSVRPDGKPSGRTALLEATQAREKLAGDVVAGRISAAEALAALPETGPADTLGLGASGELALASLDVAHRLLARGRPAEAEVFFRAAETEFGVALSSARSEERSAATRAIFLRNRALIRANYLGKPAEARDDFAEAIRLQPDNKALVRQRDTALSAHAEHSRANARN